jgi:hypothetical protein
MSPTDPPDYPWYQVVTGRDLEQGDLLLGCPRFVFPTPLPVSTDGGVPFGKNAVNAVVLTQSCDLAVRADGRSQSPDVLLCQFVFEASVAGAGFWAKEESWEEVRKGRRPHPHLLNAAKLPGLDLDFMLVDFHQVFALPVGLVRGFAAGAGDRPRLRPPYREHLSQAFARLFMRVGLPADIPPFARKKQRPGKRRRGGRWPPRRVWSGRGRPGGRGQSRYTPVSPPLGVIVLRNTNWSTLSRTNRTAPSQYRKLAPPVW